MKLVLGITGQTGSAAADVLLERGEPVRALVRDEARAAAWKQRGVELVRGEADDSDALAKAARGVNGAYVLVPPALSHPNPRAWYEAVATAIRNAAREVGLPRLVFLSSEGAHLPAGTGAIGGLHAAETILTDAAASTTFLRPAYFQENWRGLLPVVQADGVLPSFLGNLDRPRAMVATRDIGRVAAELLLSDEAPTVVELAGPEDYSSNDVAEAIAAVIGRQVTAVAPPRTEWVSTVISAGVGAPFAQLLLEMYEAIGSGHVRFSDTVPIRRGPTNLRDNVRSWVADDQRGPVLD